MSQNVYQKQSEVLNGRDSKKVANNTYLQRRGPDAIALRYHATDVVMYYADNRIVLDTGGWQTSTTKLRFNEDYAHLPIRSVYANKGVWYVDTGKFEIPHKRRFGCWQCRKNWTAEVRLSEATQNLSGEVKEYCPKCGKAADYAGSYETVSVPFADGLTFKLVGDRYEIDMETAGEDPRQTQKLRRRIKAYAAGYVAALRAGNVPAPSGGDCFGCQFKTQDGKAPFGSDHILLHLEEKYYVPSLIVRAAETMPCSQVMKWTIAESWRGIGVENSMRDHSLQTFKKIQGGTMPDFVWQQLRKLVGRYVMRQLGMVS